jgi:DNA-directed RNA polymerase specialized sigma24 family protein
VINLTENELSQYRKLKCEISDLEDRINKLLDKELATCHSKVSGSSKHFPYIEFHMDVVIEDPGEVSDRDQLIDLYRRRQSAARAAVLQIERFISEIPESELRMIFQYRYIDGKKLREIGELMNSDRSVIGKRINRFLNLPPFPQNL